jgi:hypothetical protein
VFNVRPNLRVPGFNVREPEEEVPGFHLNADGTIGNAPMAAAKPNGNPFDILERQNLDAFTPVGNGSPPPYPAFARYPRAGSPAGEAMFNMLPGLPMPGLHNFKPPEEPGFRLNADASIREGSAPAVASDAPLADGTLPEAGQMSGDVIPICSLFARTPSLCVYRCEKGANVATPSNGHCPSIIRQPPWL